MTRATRNPDDGDFQVPIKPPAGRQCARLAFDEPVRTAKRIITS